MKENGRMIFNMEKELKRGQMDLDMKENMHLEENMEQGHINGMTVQNILEIGKKIRYLVSVFIHGLMEESMKENG